MHRLVASLATLLIVPACGSPAKTAPPAWRDPACVGDLPADIPVDCAAHEVPRKHDQPAGAKLSLYVHHVPALEQRKGQVWLLNGGPGQSGLGWLGAWLVAARTALPGYDFYIPDHRGTGLSTPLQCARTLASNKTGNDWWLACIAEAEQTAGSLDAFTATEAARDVATLIDEERHGDEPVYVWGVSYGSFWAHRYLQVAPTQPSGVVLESLCLNNCEKVPSDANVDATAQQLLAVCGADAFCAGKLGADPWSRAVALMGQPSTFCSDLGGPKALRGALAGIASGAPTLLPMALYRAERCNASDVSALRLIEKYLGAPQAGWSDVLSMNIELSEIWVPKDAPTAQAEDAALTISSDSDSFGAKVYPVWPVYPHDQYFGQWATSTAPLLMLSGTLDFGTSGAGMDDDASHFTAPNQRRVIFPNEGHAPSVRSPCAQSVGISFLRDPGAPLDTACVTSLPPLDFHVTTATSRRILGTDDAWEGTPTAH
jgi:pimeloyl-ACP methyl ester carboxylesterase